MTLEGKIDKDKDKLLKIKKFVEDDSENGCKLLSERYTSNDSTMRFLCKCGRYFETSFNGFKNGKQKCGHCSGRKDKRRRNVPMNWTISEMKKFVEIHSESGCKFLSADREGVSATVTLKCICGNIFSLRFDFFRDRLKRRECDHCVESKKFNKVKTFVESCNCELLNEKYTNAEEKLSFRCECGRTFNTSYNAFKNMGQRRCRFCSDHRSSGEKKIYEHLKLLDINFEEEYIDTYCQNILPLPFDFAIMDINSKPNSLIEFDGQQHFEPVRFGGISIDRAEDRLDEQVRNDNIKTQYCQDNNIPLLRIPYWDFDNIENILDEWIANTNA